MTERGALWWQAVERAAERPAFLAAPLLWLARIERLDHAALAGRLGCAVERLPVLLLCKRPGAATFADDVRSIATRFHLDPATLAEAIRLADSLQAFQAPDDAVLLAAARDRAEEEPPP